MHLTPERIGLIGDLHGNQHAARRAIVSLAEHQVPEIHFLGDFGFIGDGTLARDRALKPVVLALRKAGAIGYVTGGNHEHWDELDRIAPDAEGLRWIRKNIALLPRGWRAVSPSGVKLASLGGANSISRFRTRGGPWYPQEQITEADLRALGRDPVDVLLGHDSPVTEALTRRLVKSESQWDARGIEYARAGQQMFHRGFLQVRPSLTLGGHYHQHLDVTEQFTDEPGAEFTARCVVLNSEYAYPSATVLDTRDLSLMYLGSRG